MDEPRIRSFLLARGLLERAEISLDGTAPGMMAAVVLYDLAVETGAKAAAAIHCPTALEGEPRLPALLDAVGKVARESKRTAGVGTAEIRGAKQLHRLRNFVQHDGEPPPPGSIEPNRARARAFLGWVTDYFFGVEFDRISRTFLIRSGDVKSNVERAETFAVEDEFDQAAEALAIALEFARIRFRTGQTVYLRPLKRHQVRSAISGIKSGSTDRYAVHRYRDLEELLTSLAAHVELLVDRVESLSLGHRAPEYEWFRRRFPGVGRQVAANERGFELYTYPGTTTITREIYERGHDFVVTSVLHWQQFPAAEQLIDGNEDEGTDKA